MAHTIKYNGKYLLLMDVETPKQGTIVRAWDEEEHKIIYVHVPIEIKK